MWENVYIPGHVGQNSKGILFYYYAINNMEAYYVPTYNLHMLA